MFAALQKITTALEGWDSRSAITLTVMMGTKTKISQARWRVKSNFDGTYHLIHFKNPRIFVVEIVDSPNKRKVRHFYNQTSINYTSTFDTFY